MGRIRENENLEVVSNGGSECILSGIYLYETFLVSDRLVRERGTGSTKSESVKRLSLFSGSSLKRHLVYERGRLIWHLPSLRRIVRVHCIFDTNSKVQVIRKGSGEVVFGSRDLDPHGFEQRVLVFECDSFSHVKDPVTFDPASIDLDELFPREPDQPIDSSSASPPLDTTMPHNVKAHRRKLIMKR